MNALFSRISHTLVRLISSKQGHRNITTSASTRHPTPQPSAAAKLASAKYDGPMCTPQADAEQTRRSRAPKAVGCMHLLGGLAGGANGTDVSGTAGCALDVDMTSCALNHTLQEQIAPAICWTERLAWRTTPV